MHDENLPQVNAAAIIAPIAATITIAIADTATATVSHPDTVLITSLPFALTSSLLRIEAVTGIGHGCKHVVGGSGLIGGIIELGKISGVKVDTLKWSLFK